MSNLDDYRSEFDNIPDDDKIPAGEYEVELKGSKVETYNEGDCAKIACRFLVCDGQYEGQSFFLDFIIRHGNAKVKQIGLRNFKQLVTALGVHEMPSDTADLHGLKCKLKFDYYKEKYVNFKSARAIGGLEDSPF